MYKPVTMLEARNHFNDKSYRLILDSSVYLGIAFLRGRLKIEGTARAQDSVFQIEYLPKSTKRSAEVGSIMFDDLTELDMKTVRVYEKIEGGLQVKPQSPPSVQPCVALSIKAVGDVDDSSKFSVGPTLSAKNGYREKSYEVKMESKGGSTQQGSNGKSIYLKANADDAKGVKSPIASPGSFPAAAVNVFRLSYQSLYSTAPIYYWLKQDEECEVPWGIVDKIDTLAVQVFKQLPPPVKDCLVLDDNARKDVLALDRYKLVALPDVDQDYKDGSYSVHTSIYSVTIKLAADDHASDVNVYELDYDKKGTMMFWLAKGDQCKIPEQFQVKVDPNTARVYRKVKD
jgi:hypothetical protein